MYTVISKSISLTLTKYWYSLCINITKDVKVVNTAFYFSTDKCKFMDSKMRPLWMVWKNYDTVGGSELDFYVMYKNGDGEFINMYIF